MKKIKELLKKYREIIVYVFFGGLTTVVNYVVYFICKAVGIEYGISTVIAWIAAVAFAYITNRVFVFKSTARGFKLIFKEIALFVSARIFSLGLELIIMFVGMDLLKAGEFTAVTAERTLPLGEFITKTVAQVVIVISNYVFSKIVIFKSKDKTEKVKKQSE